MYEQQIKEIYERCDSIKATIKKALGGLHVYVQATGEVWSNTGSLMMFALKPRDVKEKVERLLAVCLEIQG